MDRIRGREMVVGDERGMVTSNPGMMSGWTSVGSRLALAAFVSVGAVPDADGEVLSVRTELRAGIAGGSGLLGQRKDDAFHNGGVRPGYGILVGGELLFFDAWIQHDQFLSFDSVSGTWTQFMLGIDAKLPLGAHARVGFNDEGETKDVHRVLFLELGMGVGFGVGTGKQVDPPLDNSELTDKGFLFEGRAMLAYQVNSFVSLGVSLPVSFGYFTKTGLGTFVNDLNNHYTAITAAGLLTVRASWTLK